MNLPGSKIIQNPASLGSARITQRSFLTAALIHRLEWSACFLSLTSLLFSNFSPPLAASGFLASAALFGAIRPNRAVRALTSDWLPWIFIALAFLSISWSPVPDLSLRYAFELSLTAAAALVLARGVEPSSLL
jgi:exopolysaccharide production protein ExoQ